MTKPMRQVLGAVYSLRKSHVTAARIHRLLVLFENRDHRVLTSTYLARLEAGGYIEHGRLTSKGLKELRLPKEANS